MYLYLIFGMASLGTLIGLFVAWSASPIASIALPLIFGLIGGASGFSVAKMDVTEPSNVSKLKLLGQTLAAFSLACIVGVVVGIASRSTLGLFDNPRHNIELAGDEKPETIIDYLILRRKLELVGASEDEIASLLSRIKADATNDRQFEALDTAIGLLGVLAPQSGKQTKVLPNFPFPVARDVIPWAYEPPPPPQ